MCKMVNISRLVAFDFVNSLYHQKIWHPAVCMYMAVGIDNVHSTVPVYKRRSRVWVLVSEGER